MKYFFLFAALVAVRLNAQTTLSFDKRFVQSEDKWVAFPPGEDSSYVYGFIYIDEQAGLTLNYEGRFKISPTGTFVPEKLESTSMKVRLEPNDVLVAFIPESKFQELRVAAAPEWLKYYKTDTNSVARLYRWGFMYNGWSECARALTYLQIARQIDPGYKGLSAELAFSYNCLEQYSDAEAILEKEIQINPSDAYVNKEYIYTLVKSNNIDKAVKQFNISLETMKDKQYHAENCYNILQYYFTQKNKTNFSKWYIEFQKHPNENKIMVQYADKMNRELNK